MYLQIIVTLRYIKKHHDFIISIKLTGDTIHKKQGSITDPHSSRHTIEKVYMLRRTNEVYEEPIALPLLSQVGQILVIHLIVQGLATAG
jgi:hypothetical protein